MARARDMKARGDPLSQIATELGVSKSTARNWTRDVAVGPPPPLSLADELTALATELDQADAAREAGICRRAADALRLARSAAAAAPSESLPDPTLSTREWAMGMVQWVQERVGESADRGNDAAVKQLIGQIERLARLGKQAADAESETVDAVTIPLADIAAQTESARQVLRRYAEQPLTCARCGVELRMALALQEAGVTD